MTTLLEATEIVRHMLNTAPAILWLVWLRPSPVSLYHSNVFPSFPTVLNWIHLFSLSEGLKILLVSQV